MARLDAHPTVDQDVVSSTPTGSTTFFHGDFIMKYFLWSFSPFRWFKKGSCQFLVKECAQHFHSSGYKNRTISILSHGSKKWAWHLNLFSMTRVKSYQGKWRSSFWKHAYPYKLKILSPKNENSPIKNSDIFHISAQNIDCGYSLELHWWGSSNEYPQSMF